MFNLDRKFLVKPNRYHFVRKSMLSMFIYIFVYAIFTHAIDATLIEINYRAGIVIKYAAGITRIVKLELKVNSSAVN